MSTYYLSDDVMHRQAADIYESQLEENPRTPTEKIQSASDLEIRSLFAEGAGETSITDGDLRMILLAMCDEAENWPNELSSGFCHRSALLMVPILKYMLWVLE
jgi:hypothetical protein